MQYILEVENLSFTYLDGTRAIHDLSMRIPGGKKIGVVGKNGAGKSTLFLHFNGINRPGTGVVKFKGETVTYEQGRLKRLRRSIGVVFQNPDDQLFSASVYQDVSFGPVNLGWPEEKVRQKIEEVLRKTGVWEVREKPVHFLSHGQKKRVAIAGVLAMEPEVIILDEPTSGLDPYYSQQLLELLDTLNEAGSTVIISSHNIDEVYAWADYVFVLNEGRLMGEGLPEEVFRNAEILREANLVKPWVLEVFDRLEAGGRIKENKAVPRTRQELLDLL